MNPENYEHYQMQDALQQNQIDAQQSAYAPQLMEQMQQNQAVLVNETNPKKAVHNIMLRLRGLEEKPDGTVCRIAEEKINKDGQDNIWFILDSHINQNIILSHLDIKEIGAMMESIQEDLVDDLSLNWRKYGIKKKTDLDTINNSILTNIFVALKRAQEQNEKNWLGKISVENISGGQRIAPPKKESIWSKFRL